MATKLPDGTSITLKYLFEVEYKNGETYKQNPDDLSVTDPVRSCFFDVKQDEVKRFSLVGEGNTLTVDLTDGHFELNGVSFMVHEEALKDFRIMYFRVRDIHFDVGMQYRGEHDVTYRLGWQANTDDGKNRQRFIDLK